MSERVRAFVGRHERIDGLSGRQLALRAIALSGVDEGELYDRSDVYLTAYAEARLDEFDPDQVRDEDGKWSSTGGGGGGGGTSSSESGSSKPSRELTVKKYKAHSGFKGSAKHTEELHKENGHWTPPRQALHRSYLNAAKAQVPKGDGVVYMTGGGPAAGKSKGLLQNPKVGIPNAKQAVHADPDGAKEWIPEFAEYKHSDDPSVATRVHEESAYMSQEAVKEGLAGGHDVVYDSSGDGGIDKLEKKVKAMRANGAKKVVAHYATVDVDEAIKRSDARAKVEGRFVPHAYLRKVHQDVTRTALGAIERGVYDKLDLWDTSAAGEPVHVATYDKAAGGLKIHDDKAWENFKKRG